MATHFKGGGYQQTAETVSISKPSYTTLWSSNEIVHCSVTPKSSQVDQLANRLKKPFTGDNHQWLQHFQPIIRLNIDNPARDAQQRHIKCDLFAIFISVLSTVHTYTAQHKTAIWYVMQLFNKYNISVSDVGQRVCWQFCIYKSYRNQFADSACFLHHSVRLLDNY